MSEKKVFIKRRSRRRKVCYCCAEKIDMFDYRDLLRLNRFITDRGKIVPKRNSGACAKHQRMVAATIKRARYMALVPFTEE